MAALIASAQASWSWGGCPAAAPQATFDLERYTGMWYSLIRDKDMGFTNGSSCNSGEYTLNPEGYITVRNFAVRNGAWLDARPGRGIQSSKGDASLVVDLYSDVTPSPDRTPGYNIMSTDYDSYSIVYNCTEYYGGMYAKKSFWVLYREPTFPSMNATVDILMKVAEVLPEYDVFSSCEATK